MTYEERVEEIRRNPEKHRHDFAGLRACCMTAGALDLGLMEAHTTYAPVGSNGGQPCDVLSGPCSCGAFH